MKGYLWQRCEDDSMRQKILKSKVKNPMVQAALRRADENIVGIIKDTDNRIVAEVDKFLRIAQRNLPRSAEGGNDMLAIVKRLSFILARCRSDMVGVQQYCVEMLRALEFYCDAVARIHKLPRADDDGDDPPKAA